MKLGLIGLALVLAASACTSDITRSSSTNGPLAFVADTAPDGAAVFLREQPNALQPNRLMVEVVARGAGDLHGAAFRVTWDPQAIAFVSAERGERWSNTAIALAKEAAPGQLLVTWTEKGERGIDASGETVLGTLVFESRSRRGTAIAFKTERSMLVDKKGVALKAAWSGGSVAPH